MDSYPKPTLATEETARERERERLTEREKVGVLRPAEREKKNSKSWFDKDCTLGSVKTLTTSPC